MSSGVRSAEPSEVEVRMSNARTNGRPSPDLTLVETSADSGGIRRKGLSEVLLRTRQGVLEEAHDQREAAERAGCR